MGYEFSFGWAGAGFLVVIAGVAFLRFHQIIADVMGSGMADYERYKLFALITIGVGFAAMVNIVPLILYFVLGSLFGSGSV